jgi:hypothetical protein
MSKSASLYTVQAPPGPLAQRAEKLETLADGFSWRGFAFGPFWLLANKLWTPALALLTFDAGVNVAILKGALNPLAGSLCVTLGALWVGLEGAEMRRRKLARHGAGLIDLVVASSQDEAEAHALRRLAARESALQTQESQTRAQDAPEEPRT